VRSRAIRKTAGWFGVLLVWEFLARTFPAVRETIASPTLIVEQYWSNAGLYAPHLLGTVRSAALGFLLGNVVALAAATLFCRFPALEGALRGVNVAVFAMPPIVVGPILAIIFSGSLPQIILSALVVYFPTMAATLVGLRDTDSRLIDVIRTCGGGSMAAFRFARMRSALPALFAGLSAAAPLAVLGAMLGEFGSGARWGLGSFLLGSLGSGDPAKLLGIGFLAAAIALIGHGVFAWIGERVVGSTMAVTIAPERSPDQLATEDRSPLAARGVLLLAALSLPFLLWWLLLRLSHLSPIVAPGPIDTLLYLVSGPEAADARRTLLAALGETVPLAALGLVAGIAAAFLLAALAVLRPRLEKAILPAALLLQSMPLVAFVPVVLLLLGRDRVASVAMAVLVVFFPAYVLLSQGFALVPAPARELVEVYGGNRSREFVLISVPYAAPYVFAAAKLVAPRALLGVMVAEWLLSGRGLGNLLNASRGLLDYDMVWAGTVTSILLSVAAYEAISKMERVLR
jgi:sulfonate transport system permease protein